MTLNFGITPIIERPEDSPSYVLDRTELAWELLEDAGIRPVAWLTPHYQASPLDYRIFADIFPWNVGRTIYFPFTEFSDSSNLNPRFNFNVSGTTGKNQRWDHFKNLKAKWPEELLPAGQIFPYEIYGDFYNQKLIPEVNGNIELYFYPECGGDLPIRLWHRLSEIAF